MAGGTSFREMNRWRDELSRDESLEEAFEAYHQSICPRTRRRRDIDRRPPPHRSLAHAAHTKPSHDRPGTLLCERNGIGPRDLPRRGGRHAERNSRASGSSHSRDAHVVKRVARPFPLNVGSLLHVPGPVAPRRPHGDVHVELGIAAQHTHGEMQLVGWIVGGRVRPSSDPPVPPWSPFEELAQRIRA